MAHSLKSVFPTANRRQIGWRLFPASYIDDWEPTQDYHCCSSLDDILSHAETNIPDFKTVGSDLAFRLGGEFLLGPLKEKKRVEQICKVHHRHPGEITDYVRGCILLDDLHDVVRARKKIREWVNSPQDIIVQSIDRYSCPPPKSDLRGIFLNVALPSGHIAEIQVHLRDYWEELKKTHKTYEDYRNAGETLYMNENYLYRILSGTAEDKDYERKDASIPEQKRECKLAKKQRTNELQSISARTGVDTLRLHDRGFEGDCSFPIRPTIAPQTGEKAFFVVDESEILKQIIRRSEEGYIECLDPTWKPEWKPSTP